MTIDEFKGIVLSRRRAAEMRLNRYDNEPGGREKVSRDALVAQLEAWRDVASLIREIE